MRKKKKKVALKTVKMHIKLVSLPFDGGDVVIEKLVHPGALPNVVGLAHFRNEDWARVQQLFDSLFGGGQIAVEHKLFPRGRTQVLHFVGERKADCFDSPFPGGFNHCHVIQSRHSLLL